MRNPCENQDYTECHVAITLWKIFSPAFLLIGLPGNALAVVILSRKRMCGTTTSVYLRVLAVVDFLALIVSMLREMISYYFRYDVRDVTDLSCKLQSWLTYNATGLSCWLLSVIAIDRLVSIKYPLWTKTHCKRTSAVMLAVIMTVIVLLLNSHMLWILKKDEIQFNSNYSNTSITLEVTCQATSHQFVVFWDRIWPICVLVLYSILPIICLITCNIFLISKLVKRNKKFQSVNRGKGAKAQSNGDLRSITIMLIAACLFFIIVTIPVCVYVITLPFLYPSTPQGVARRTLAWSIAGLILYSNHSFNFLIYCLTGSLFRQELIRAFQEVKIRFLRKFNWKDRTSHFSNSSENRPVPAISYIKAQQERQI